MLTFFASSKARLTCMAVRSEAYSEQCQASKMEPFAKIVSGRKPLTAFAKLFILNVRQRSEYVSGDNYLFSLPCNTYSNRNRKADDFITVSAFI